jgi:hypothetical protein
MSDSPVPTATPAPTQPPPPQKETPPTPIAEALAKAEEAKKKVEEKELLRVRETYNPTPRSLETMKHKGKATPMKKKSTPKKAAVTKKAQPRKATPKKKVVAPKKAAPPKLTAAACASSWKVHSLSVPPTPPLPLLRALREKLLNRFYFSKMRGDLKPAGVWWTGRGTAMYYIFLHRPEMMGLPASTKPALKAMSHAVGRLPELGTDKKVKTILEVQVPRIVYYGVEVRPTAKLLQIVENDLKLSRRRHKRAEKKEAEVKRAPSVKKPSKHFKNARTRIESVDAPEHDLKTALHEPTIFHKLARLNDLDRFSEVSHLLKDRRNPMDINSRDKGGWTALHCAARWSGTPMLVKLLKVGSNPKLRTKNNLTLLHCAAMNDDTEGPIVCLHTLEPKLFDQMLEARDRDGRTPLHYAADAENLRAVKALLDRGADKTATDKEGRTPRQYIPIENIGIMQLLGRRTK